MLCSTLAPLRADTPFLARKIDPSPFPLAPINGGHCYQLDRRLDQDARVQISYELGHNRIVVVAAYVGGRA